MKFHAEFRFIQSLSFAPSNSLIPPLNSDLNCTYVLQVLIFAYAPANFISKHGKEPRSKKYITSTRKGITHPHIHKFSPIVFKNTGWFLMNLHIYKFSPIIHIYTYIFLMNPNIHKFSPITCVYTGWFLMNLNIRKFSPVVCLYTGWFLMTLHIHNFFLLYAYI
jgi:hypothetical protein